VRFIRAAGAEILGLFVGDWLQTAVSVGILALAWLALSRFHLEGLAFVLALALAAQLVYATTREASARGRLG
jgi:hypothetical protein